MKENEFFSLLGVVFRQPETNPQEKEPQVVNFFSAVMAEINKRFSSAAQEASEPEPAVMSIETQDNGVLMHMHGLKIIHICHPEQPRGKGMTIAYKGPGERYTGKAAATLEVATAVVHPLDHFNKKKGANIALTNFIAGHTVTIPRIEGHDETETLRAFFGASIFR